MTYSNLLRFVSVISCGPLLKKEGVIKVPPAANYLDGDTVTFSCKPRYFIHGDITRKCVNGTWTPGWWAWCRGMQRVIGRDGTNLLPIDRNLEYALKWMTALLSIFGMPSRSESAAQASLLFSHRTRNHNRFLRPVEYTSEEREACTRRWPGQSPRKWKKLRQVQNSFIPAVCT